MGQTKSLAQIVEEYVRSGKVELPVFDQTAARMQEMISRGEFDPEAIEGLVGSDPALSGTLLRHANSSFFGGIDKAVTVRDAIMRLGVKQVAELVILSKHGAQYRLQTPDLRALSEGLWRHAVGCGMGARWLATKLDLREERDEAFLCGLLHDIGKLLLVRVLDELIVKKHLRFPPNRELVLKLLDGLHVEQGAMLMQVWNMPEIYTRIVSEHHSDDCDENDTLGNLLRLTDMACNRLGIGVRGKIDINLAACNEALHLRASEVALAELEIRLEDAMQLAQ